MFALALQGSREQSKVKLLNAIGCIRNVREAWQKVALDPEAQKMLPPNLRTIEEHIGRVAVPLAAKPDRYDGGDGALPDSCRWMA